MNTIASDLVISIQNYRPEHQCVFERLNRAWIEEHFEMEAVDVLTLKHPDLHIIGKGGAILMAYAGDDVAGTVALKYNSPGVYEFTKMAVDETFRGKKIGQALALAAIDKARNLQAQKIILYSNTKLKAAIGLYRKLGFKEIPLDALYRRSDIKMELQLV
jgi:ribosomal protein S18 acetylase RimI-like enzyme